MGPGAEWPLFDCSIENRVTLRALSVTVTRSHITTVLEHAENVLDRIDATE
jgi:hypothetical protein